MRYDFHGLATLVLDTDDKHYLRYFHNEYAPFATDSPGSRSRLPEITVHLVGELPDEKRGDIQRHIRFKKLFRFSFIVRGVTTPRVQVFFKKHPVGSVYVTAVGVFLQAQVLEPLLYMKLVQRGVLLMHAAGVSDGSHGYLFPAYGGAGKTTLSLGLIGHGFKLLGDDLVLVDPTEQRVYPYPRPLHLFTYNIHTLGDARIPFSLRARVRAKDAARFVLERFTGEEFLISTRAHVADLYGRAVVADEPVEYRKMKLLRNSRNKEVVPLSQAGSRDEIAHFIIRSADLNDSLYHNILDESPEVAREVRRLEKEVTGSILARLREVEYIDPRSMGVDELRAFAERLRA